MANYEKKILASRVLFTRYIIVVTFVQPVTHTIELMESTYNADAYNGNPSIMGELWIPWIYYPLNP